MILDIENSVSVLKWAQSSITSFSSDKKDNYKLIVKSKIHFQVKAMK